MRRLVALAVLAAAGCGESTPPELGATRAEIEGIVRKFHEKMDDGDLDAVAALCAPDFSIVWSGDEPTYGRENALKVLQKFIDYQKARDMIGKRKPKYGDIRVRQEGWVAIATYEVGFKDESQSVELFTHIFRRESGKWMLIHDHRVKGS